MTDQSGPALFRRKATVAYRIVCVFLAAVVLLAGWLGWHFGGWVGLAVGTVGAAVFAGAAWFAVTLLWAMTQDGA